jgi:hypothetical protein
MKAISGNRHQLSASGEMAKKIIETRRKRHRWRISEAKAFNIENGWQRKYRKWLIYLEEKMKAK